MTKESRQFFISLVVFSLLAAILISSAGFKTTGNFSDISNGICLAEGDEPNESPAPDPNDPNANPPEDPNSW